MSKRKTQLSAVRSIKDQSRETRGSVKSDVIFPVPTASVHLPKGYADLLAELKVRIKSERLRVVMASNAAMVILYWDIGKRILERQSSEGWGARTIDRLSHDLRRAFPEMSGFSPRNLKYMRAFAASWPEQQIVQEALARLTWYQNLALLEKLSDPTERLWYARKTLEHGWSRNILVIQIETKAHLRSGKAVENFSKTFWKTKLTRSLPKGLKGSLPTIEEIEAELQSDSNEEEGGN